MSSKGSSPLTTRFATPRAAICETCTMSSGVHYAEFAPTSCFGCVGVARPDFDVQSPDMGLCTRSARSLARDARTRAQGGTPMDSSVTWAYDLYDGELMYAGEHHEWDGQKGWQPGQALGLQLDLAAGTVEVFLDGQRLGRMAEGLEGPLCWYAEIWQGGGAVRIQAKPPPSQHRQLSCAEPSSLAHHSAASMQLYGPPPFTGLAT